jgi:hypothetical protein
MAAKRVWMNTRMAATVEACHASKQSPDAKGWPRQQARLFCFFFFFFPTELASR